MTGKTTVGELYHHGIIGMKWGVIRSPEELGHYYNTLKYARNELLETGEPLNYHIQEREYSKLTKEMDKVDKKIKFWGGKTDDSIYPGVLSSKQDQKINKYIGQMQKESASLHTPTKEDRLITRDPNFKYSAADRKRVENNVFGIGVYKTKKSFNEFQKDVKNAKDWDLKNTYVDLITGAKSSADGDPFWRLGAEGAKQQAEGLATVERWKQSKKTK